MTAAISDAYVLDITDAQALPHDNGPNCYRLLINRSAMLDLHLALQELI